jgi:succinyl-CoA synthetase alpha subunit
LHFSCADFISSKATANVKESLEWGTKIVGGVKPGVEGEHLGLPIFPSVKVVSYANFIW